jgi:mannose-6-phosphate isomerase-like protein (cupin superfamily)
MLKAIRRVVTGHDAAGMSRVVEDAPAQKVVENPHWPGRGQTRLWTSTGAPASNAGSDDPAPRANTLEPPPLGTHFLIAQVMPEADLEKLAPEQRQRIHEALFAAIGSPHAQSGDTARPAMHQTHTVDYVTVLSGEVTLVLDEGEVTLGRFDTVVQRGTKHAWVNRGSEPALLAVVLVDAKPLQ